MSKSIDIVFGATRTRSRTCSTFFLNLARCRSRPSSIVYTVPSRSAYKKCQDGVKFPESPYKQRPQDSMVSDFTSMSKATIWKYITIPASIPVLCQFFYLTFMANLHPEREEFVAWPHLRLRARAFPWGDGNHSFFHNKYYNALPDGYEEDD